MFRIRYPRTDESRIQLLMRIEQTATDERTAGRVHIPPNLLADVVSSSSTFRPLVHELADLFTIRGYKIAERNEAVADLDRHLRAFRSSVINLKRMEQFRDVYLRYYRITPTFPTNPTPDQLFEIATHYVIGDRAAVANGFPTMTNPTVSTIRTKRNEAQTKIQEANIAKRAMDEVQHRLVSMRNEVDILIRIVSQQLNLSLYRLPPDDARAIKRIYGFQYITDDEEEGADEEETLVDKTVLTHDLVEDESAEEDTSDLSESE